MFAPPCNVYRYNYFIMRQVSTSLYQCCYNLNDISNYRSEVILNLLFLSYIVTYVILSSRVKKYHHFMMVLRNQFVDGDMSDRTSLIHLLDNNDTEDNNEAHIIKHSPYYSESKFTKISSKKGGLSILSVNIQCVNAKFDEFQAFVNKIYVIKPINIICLQECWLKKP